MIKNLFLLVLLTFVSFTYAKHPVVKESIGDAGNYKVEKPVEEQDAQRSVAGAKIKKNKKKALPGAEESSKSFSEDSDSEVRYWEYSE